MNNAIDQFITDKYAIYNGDSCELIKNLPDNSVHFSMYSPPFVGLYRFSNSERDLSNSEDNDFFTHYEFLLREILRVTKPGRISAVHCMQLPTSKTRNGFIGVRDFRGDVIRAHQRAGWHFHSEICIFKDPVIAQQRTKSIRLLHKQITKDSCVSGQGLADYVVVFRKPGENPEPVAGMFDEYHGAPALENPSDKTKTGRDFTQGLDISRSAYDRHKAIVEADGGKVWPFDMWVSVLVWQRYASPVWMDIDQTRTLQNKRWNPDARDERDANDEQHISPLQLDVIERCIDLWTNPNDVVLTPFMGIGSEVWASVNMGRKGIGFELKPSYFAQAKHNLAYLDKMPDSGLFLTDDAAE